MVSCKGNEVDGRGIYRKFGMRVNYEMNYWWKKENIKKGRYF